MRSPRAFARFLWSRLHREALDREMDEEMEFHLALHAEALERAGCPPAEARRRAIADFGGVQRYREESRDARAFAWLHDVAADLRYAMRVLRRAPGFTALAIISLGIGIGVTVLVFGLVYGLLMQPLPIPHAGDLTAVVVRARGDGYPSVLRRTYQTLRRTPGVTDLEAIHEADDILVEAGERHEYRRVDFVDGGFFSLLGVRPAIGRFITPDDDSTHAPVVLLSDAAWTQFFGRDPDVLGRSILLRGHSFTVIGVMPRAYRGIRFNGSFTMAVPSGFGRDLGILDDRNYVNVVARVAPAERGRVAALLDAVYRRCCLEQESADAHLAMVSASTGIPFGKTDFRGEYRLVLWALLAGAVLVLLIACSNVGNLLLARCAARQRELAVRLSIGASRGRVIRQLLAESGSLTVAGTVLGFGVAAAATTWLLDVLLPGFESATELVRFGPKPAILAFTIGMALVSMLAFGVGPALRATTGDLGSALGDRGGSHRRESRRIDELLVIGQIALTLVLVCGAGLLVATLRNLRAVDPGFVPEHLAAFEIETRGTAYEPTGIVPLYRDILELVRGVRGVASAAMATRLPAVGGRSITFPYAVSGATPDSTQVSLTVVTPGYFATTRTPLLLGRDFTDADKPGTVPVAIASESFIRRHFQGRTPLGATVRIDRLNGGETVTLVGVAHDVQFGDRRDEVAPMLYIAAAQAGKWPFLLVVARTSGPPARIMPSVMRTLAPVAARLRVTNPQTMDAAIDVGLLRERLAAGFTSVCAALALVLAMVGLAGLIALSVTRRTREIGVRVALGAEQRSVVWLVVRGALGMAAAGVLIGGPLALGAGQALRSLLFGVAPFSPLLLGAAVGGIVLLALAASAAPAWRASRVDPVIALRAD